MILYANVYLLYIQVPIEYAKWCINLVIVIARYVHENNY